MGGNGHSKGIGWYRAEVTASLIFVHSPTLGIIGRWWSPFPDQVLANILSLQGQGCCDVDGV